MRNLLSRLFPLGKYIEPFAQYRARNTYLSGVIFLIGALLNFLFTAAQFISNAPVRQDPGFSFSLVASVVIILTALVTLWLTAMGRQLLGALILVVVWFIVNTYLLFTNFAHIELFTIAIFIAVALGAILINENTVVYTAGAGAIFLIVQSLIAPSPSSGDPTLDALLDTVLLVVFASLMYALVHGLPVVVSQIVEANNARRLQFAEASGVVAQRLLSSRLDLQKVLAETVILVRDTFADANDVQLFLADQDRRNATLVATTQSGDQSVVGQQVGIGSLSVVGRVTITGLPIVVRDTSEDRPYRRTALLPDIHTELALPLRVGDETIGVLDVQSRKSGAFQAEEIKALESLVNQIAIAIDNARLYAEAQTQLTENKRLFDQTRSNLREIERLNQQLTGSAWTEYLYSRPATPAYTIDRLSGQEENAAEWTSTLAEAAQRNQITIRREAQAKIVALPISVRGQAIGAMEFEIAPDQELSSEQMIVLQQVVERLGLAAESSRLFEEAQRLAQREALVNEISTRLQGTTNIEGVIVAATQSLADALHAPRVAIRLGNLNSKNL